jgi:hypothetical protein
LNLSTNRCPSLNGFGKHSWSFWLNLCLKFTAGLRDLTDVCVGYRIQKQGSQSKILLNTSIAHRVSPCNVLCDLLSTFLLLNLFRLAITKGLKTYCLKTFPLFIFNEFVTISKDIIPLDIMWYCV